MRGYVLCRCHLRFSRLRILMTRPALRAAPRRTEEVTRFRPGDVLTGIDLILNPKD